MNGRELEQLDPQTGRNMRPFLVYYVMVHAGLLLYMAQSIAISGEV